MGRSRWARPLAAGALAVVVAAGLGACVTSGYTYITNTSTKTYFKVPQRWKLFNQSQILQGESGLISPQQAQTSRQQQWVVAFDGDPRPAISHVLDEHSRYPMGFARVRALTDEERDTYSLSSLRNEVLPLDRLMAVDGRVDTILDKEIKNGGLRGARVVNNIRGQDSILTLDQSALIDAGTHVAYVLVVGCEARCYVDNQKVIDEIVHSWTVKER